MSLHVHLSDPVAELDSVDLIGRMPGLARWSVSGLVVSSCRVAKGIIAGRNDRDNGNVFVLCVTASHGGHAQYTLVYFSGEVEVAEYAIIYGICEMTSISKL